MAVLIEGPAGSPGKSGAGLEGALEMERATYRERERLVVVV